MREHKSWYMMIVLAVVMLSADIVVFLCMLGPRCAVGEKHWSELSGQGIWLCGRHARVFTSAGMRAICRPKEEQKKTCGQAEHLDGR